VRPLLGLLIFLLGFAFALALPFFLPPFLLALLSTP
jgi:hypothetical protein